MNHSRLLKAVAPAVCALILVVAPIRAQIALPGTEFLPRTNINPGLLYWQAFEALPRSDAAIQKELNEFAEQLTRWSSASAVAETVEVPVDASFHGGAFDHATHLFSGLVCWWHCVLCDECIQRQFF